MVKSIGIEWLLVLFHSLLRVVCILAPPKILEDFVSSHLEDIEQAMFLGDCVRTKFGPWFGTTRREWKQRNKQKWIDAIDCKTPALTILSQILGGAPRLRDGELW